MFWDWLEVTTLVAFRRFTIPASPHSAPPLLIYQPLRCDSGFFLSTNKLLDKLAYHVQSIHRGGVDDATGDAGHTVVVDRWND